MVAFWGCDVTETKAAVVEIPEGFVLNVCNATCGASSANGQVALGLETQQVDGKVWKGAVAHLGDKQPLQVKLDLVFGHKVKFYLAKGSGVINLTGYFQPGPPIDLFEEEEKTSNVDAPLAKKSKKRSRAEKNNKEKSWDEISSSSSDSEKVSEKKVKAAVTTPPVKKEEQKKEKATKVHAVMSQNEAAPAGTSQKKKRKKKHKKQAANGEAK